MTWLVLAHFVILTFLSFHRDKLRSSASLKSAWDWFVAVFFSQAALTVFRAGNYDDNDLVLVEIWATGFVWFFLGMSILQLRSLFVDDTLSSSNKY